MNDSPSILVNYLQQVASLQAARSIDIRGPAQYIVAYGREFPCNHVLPPSRGRGRSRFGKLGFCFQNAFELAYMHQQKYRYVEGYATTTTIGLPMSHAWCIDENDNIVDPTWGNTKSSHVGDYYFGVVIPYKLLIECTIISECYGIFDSWMAWRELVKVLDKHFDKKR